MSHTSAENKGQRKPVTQRTRDKEANDFENYSFPNEPGLSKKLMKVWEQIGWRSLTPAPSSQTLLGARPPGDVAMAEWTKVRAAETIAYCKGKRERKIRWSAEDRTKELNAS